MDAWDVIVVRQFLCIVGLATRWRSRNVDFDGVKATELIELSLKGANVLSDTKPGVPRELLLLLKLFLFFSFQLLLCSSQLYCLKGIRSLHAQVNRQLFLPA